jgi:hypothetical protein
MCSVPWWNAIIAQAPMMKPMSQILLPDDFAIVHPRLARKPSVAQAARHVQSLGEFA